MGRMLLPHEKASWYYEPSNILNAVTPISLENSPLIKFVQF
jgi:hypothetical protein